MIPSCSDLRTSDLPVRFGDLFNPPGLTNGLGSLQVGRDLTAISHLGFPPLFTGGRLSPILFVNGRFQLAAPGPTWFAWQPDRVERWADADGLALRSVTVMPPGEQAAAMVLTATNVMGSHRPVSFRLALDAELGHVVDVSSTATGLVAARLEPDSDRRAFTASSPDGVTLVQGIVAPNAGLGDSGLLASTELAPGAEATVMFVAAIGESRDVALATFDRVRTRGPRVLEDARAAWDAELQAAFTPGNSRYSGHLPTLATSDAEIRRLYWMGALGAVYFKRESPHSAIGRAYDTLMPRYWPTVNYLWDYSLGSTAHAMLDPLVMRNYLERWMSSDLGSGHSVSWLDGRMRGMWYGVNDYALVRMANDYVRWSGDSAWLVSSADASGDSIYDRLVGHARAWEKRRRSSGLADFGGIDNLLECVSTYIHQVAGMNAANVFAQRAVAGFADLCGSAGEAANLRAAADRLAEAVQQLYVPGTGRWNALQPDGAVQDVRHSYDTMTVLYAMLDDLTTEQVGEMCSFVWRELATPLWMRALSASDGNAPFSIRADHQWTGAFAAWPSELGCGLYAAGRGAEVFPWVRSMAASANQGPFGQAHFQEECVEAHAGGARKAPPEYPYITDWACSAGASWVRVIVEGIFGVRPPLHGTLTARPQFATFDTEARLENIPFQGRLYSASMQGIAAQ